MKTLKKYSTICPFAETLWKMIYNAICVLQENGAIDEDFRKSIIESERNAEILELLKN